METKQSIFPISAIADILGVHQRTLRIYDKEGLLVPDRNNGKKRVYSLADLEKGKLIQFLTRSTGVNLAGVKIIIHLLKNSKIRESKYLKSVEKIVKTVNKKQNKGKLTKKII